MHRPHPALLLLRAAVLVALAFSMATVIEYYGRGGTFCGPGGGCAHVRQAGVFGGLLPPVGVLAFTALFVMSTMRGARVGLLSCLGSLLGGAVGLFLLYVQGVEIGAFCWLCVGVDASAIVAGGSGAFLLAKRVPARRLGEGLVNPWWSLFWIAALAPVVFASTVQDPELPEAIRELYDDGAGVNIVEMADFECPYCRAMHPVLREAVERSGAGVHLTRIVVPLSFHAHARDAARAYFCASRLSGGDEATRERMADALFASDDLSREGLARAAEYAGLEGEVLTACLDEEATEARVREDLERSERAGMQGLPTVYIGERTFVGFDPNGGPERYVAAIEAAQRGEGRRFRYWPAALMVVLSLGSLLIGLRARRAATRP